MCACICVCMILVVFTKVNGDAESSKSILCSLYQVKRWKGIYSFVKNWVILNIGISLHKLHTLSHLLYAVTCVYFLCDCELLSGSYYVLWFTDKCNCCTWCKCAQAAGKFDVEVVQRQLRYTGMLATVQIRQAGYNYRLTFEVCSKMLFILPKILMLCDRCRHLYRRHHCGIIFHYTLRQHIKWAKSLVTKRTNSTTEN